MAIKNVSITMAYVAWDTANNVGKTGDVANHTIKVIKDGTSATSTNSPSEVDSTNAPGVYKLVLTATEMNGDCIVVAGKSSTSSISIIPVTFTTDHGVLPSSFPSNFTSLSIDSNGRVRNQASVQKNTAFATFMFLMTDSTNHNPVTGKSVSVTRAIDGGAFGAGSLSAVSEIGNGIYSVDFAAADLNGKNIILRATASASDDTFERITTFT